MRIGSWSRAHHLMFLWARLRIKIAAPFILSVITISTSPAAAAFAWNFALPIQMFNWVSRPGEEFHANAAAAGLVLMVITLSMNGAAILIRSRAQRNIKW